MSKAEKRGLEAYPIKEEWVGDQSGIFMDVNEPSRKVYIKGYNQALLDNKRPNYSKNIAMSDKKEKMVKGKYFKLYEEERAYLCGLHDAAEEFGNITGLATASAKEKISRANVLIAELT